jgi:Tfp pilus assembly protein PilV
LVLVALLVLVVILLAVLAVQELLLLRSPTNANLRNH